MAESTIRDNEMVTATAKPMTSKGNPAEVQNPTWLSADTTKVTVEAQLNPLIAIVKAVGPLTAGTPVRVTLDADADLGEGVVPIQGVLDVNVIAGQATTIELEVGAPTPA